MIEYITTTYHTLQLALGLSDLAVLIIVAALLIGMASGMLILMAVILLPEKTATTITTWQSPRPRKVVKNYRHVRHFNRTWNRASLRAVAASCGGIYQYRQGANQ